MLNLGLVIYASEILGFKDIVDDISKNHPESVSETICVIVVMGKNIKTVMER